MVKIRTKAAGSNGKLLNSSYTEEIDACTESELALDQWPGKKEREMWEQEGKK